LHQPNNFLSIAAINRREAAEALKARNMPAQGKHAESVLALGKTPTTSVFRRPAAFCREAAKALKAQNIPAQGKQR